jgi:type I restriction enzyme S subunit
MKDNNKQKEMDKMPKDWQAIKLGESNRIELIMGQSPPSSSYNEKRKGLPFLQGSADFGARYPHINKYTSQPMKIAEKNDVLVSVRAPVGDVNITPVKLCIGRGLAAIRVNEGNNLFYFYWIQKVKNKLAAIGAGSTFKAVTKNELYNFEIPILPLKEEQKITEILSTVDEGIQKVDEVIRRTERIKKGLMQNLFTKGIGHKEFKDTAIGEIPKEWQILRINDIGRVITGKTPPTSKEIYWNGIIPFITPEDINKNKFIYRTKRYVTMNGAKQVGNILPKNTIIVVCIGSTIGKVALTSKNSITNQQINAILIKNNIDYNYVYYYLFKKSNFLKKYSGTAAVPIIKKSLFEKIEIALPNRLKEQQKISEILSTIDKKIELQRKRKEKLERIKKSLMNDLLSGKKRVRIG